LISQTDSAGRGATSTASRLEAAIVGLAPDTARLVSMSVQYGSSRADLTAATVSAQVVRATRTLMFVDAELHSAVGQIAASASAVLALSPAA
jgi:acyl-coenzyme A thioesterase PaaI-like protein